LTSRLLRFGAIAGLVVALDQITKAWILASFHLYESRSVVDGLFHLTYVRNRGAAFGFFAGLDPTFRRFFFLAVTAVALAVILVVVRRLGPDRGWMISALALVFGGAIGNAIDRVRWGEVVDFLDFFWRGHHWPAFNVADSAITVGMGVLIALELFGRRVEKQGGEA
jgi:signal peptidase II